MSAPNWEFVHRWEDYRDFEHVTRSPSGVRTIHRCTVIVENGAPADAYFSDVCRGVNDREWVESPDRTVSPGDLPRVLAEIGWEPNHV